MVFGWLRRRRRLSDHAHGIYSTILIHARQEAFFTRLGVPDTLDGRFDLVLLHAILVFRRLKRGDRGDRQLAQAVFDLMIADFDQSLRELGVGDTGITHRIKAMTEAYHGRVVAYEEALASRERTMLGDALTRNLYGTLKDPDPGAVGMLADYVKRAVAALDDRPLSELTAGALEFPALPA